MKKINLFVFLITTFFLMAQSATSTESGTVWDEYLSDLSNSSKILNVLNFQNLNVEDINDLIIKYKFRESGIHNCYQSPHNTVQIRFRENYGTFKVRAVNFYPEHRNIPYLEIDELKFASDLEAKFGLNHEKNDYHYTVLASSHDPEAKELDLKIVFDLNLYEKTISKINFWRRSDDQIVFNSELYFIEAGPVTGDCENGRGIYQYADGFWVDGVFQEGKLYKGVPQEYDLAKQDAAVLELKTKGPSYYMTSDNSVWSKWLSDDATESILLMFNKKDFTKDDWNDLQKNYFFDKNNYEYSSLNGKFRFHAFGDEKYIHTIKIRIETPQDLQIVGIEKQMSYDDLVDRFGLEYLEDKAEFTTFYLTKDNGTKDDFLKFSFRMSDDHSKITSVSIDTLCPSKVKISGRISHLETGADPQPGVNYRWSSGEWFKGELKDGIPWNGTIYGYLDDRPEGYIKYGVVSGIFSPTILEEYN